MIHNGFGRLNDILLACVDNGIDHIVITPFGDAFHRFLDRVKDTPAAIDQFQLFHSQFDLCVLHNIIHSFLIYYWHVLCLDIIIYVSAEGMAVKKCNLPFYLFTKSLFFQLSYCDYETMFEHIATAANGWDAVKVGKSGGDGCPVNTAKSQPVNRRGLCFYSKALYFI